ncbi:MAG: hypothetical protein ABIH63_00555, partial [archaeon]
MSVINTSKLSGKLEEIIDFRISEGASKKHPVVLADRTCPSTDGTTVFLPRRVSYFVSERDNELLIADSTAHEADHIREYDEYFGSEVEQLREKKVCLVSEFGRRNFSDLEENPALAGWIDNIVKDRRVDARRREQLPGVKRHYEKVLDPSAEYFRPSVKGMSELDAFREQYLQKALIGRVVEPVPEKHDALLEKIVALTYTADSINRDKEVVTKIYQLFKENFDIKQPISKLPPMFGTGDHSQADGNSSQKGYGNQVNPRDGRESDEKKPDKLDKGEGKLHKPKKDKDDVRDAKKDDEDVDAKPEEQTDFY